MDRADRLAEILLKGVPEDESISAACRRAGLGRDTYYRITGKKSSDKSGIDLTTFFKCAGLLRLAPWKVLELILSQKKIELFEKREEEIKYSVDRRKLSKEMDEACLSLREEGRSINGIFEKERGMTERHFEDIKSGEGGCSLKVYLEICSLLRVDSVATIKKITVEEIKDGTKTDDTERVKRDI